MADCSIVTLGKLENFRDFSPEYYRPCFLQLAKRLRNWPTTRIGNLAYITDGEHGSPRWDPNSGIRYISADFIKPNFIEDASMRFISAVQALRNQRCTLQENDVLVYSVGAYAGYAAKAEPHLFPASIPRSVAIIRPLSRSSIDSGFLSVFLNSQFGAFQSKRLRAGNSQPVLALEKIRQIEFPLIPLDLQLPIGELYKESYELRLASKNSYATACQELESELGLDNLIFKKPLSYLTKASEVSDSFRIDAEFYNPVAKKIIKRIESIPHARLGDSFTIGNGFPWNSSKFLSDNSGEPVVRIRNIRPSHISSLSLTSIVPEYAKSVGVSKAKSGDVVVGMDGIKYFYASILTGPCYVNQRVAHLSAKTDIRISPEFATFVINSPLGQAQLVRDMTVATTVGHITNRDIRRLVIPTVSREFHDRITNLMRQSINGIEESKRILQKANNRLEQLIEKVVKS